MKRIAFFALIVLFGNTSFCADDNTVSYNEVDFSVDEWAFETQTYGSGCQITYQTIEQRSDAICNGDSILIYVNIDAHSLLECTSTFINYRIPRFTQICILLC